MTSKSTLLTALAASFTFAAALSAQQPPQQQGAAAPAAAPQGQRQGGGGGRGRGPIQVLTLSTTAWMDGGMVPAKYTQAGEEVSPPLTWTPVVDAAPVANAAGNTPQAPNPVKSYVLIVHDLDAPTADLAGDTLHWMVWNIPATAKGLPEHVPQGPDLADGSKQISVTGPYYRGPAAPATGPVHHYAFDLYAVDTMIDVPAANAGAAAATRTAVITAMATHVRGKATMIGKFKYTAPVKTPAK